MTDWKETIAYYFNHGKSQLPQKEEQNVQSFIDRIIYPAFEKLIAEFGKHGIHLAISPDNSSMLKGRIGILRLYKKGEGKPVFEYRPIFSISENTIFMVAEIMNEELFIANTLLKAPLNEIDESIIINDFIQAYTYTFIKYSKTINKT